jgi:hypothetical protein
LPRIDQRNTIFHPHDPVHHAGGHRGGGAKGLVDAAEIAKEEVKRQRMLVIHGFVRYSDRIIDPECCGG